MNNKKQEFAREIVRYVSTLERKRKQYLDKHLNEYKLHGSMFFIILFLDRNPGSIQDDLCAHLGIDKSGIARKCSRLEALDYIKREQSNVDRRQNMLYLTSKGNELLPIIRSLLAKWRVKVTNNMNMSEQKELFKLLELMIENIG